MPLLPLLPHDIHSSGNEALWRKVSRAAPSYNYIWLVSQVSGMHVQKWHHFKCILLNENVWIWIKISLKFVPGGPNNNFQAFVQIMAWRRSGDKPSSELIMISLLTDICVTRPQWVKSVTSSLCPFEAYPCQQLDHHCFRQWFVASLSKTLSKPKLLFSWDTLLWRK